MYFMHKIPHNILTGDTIMMEHETLANKSQIEFNENSTNIGACILGPAHWHALGVATF